MDFDQNDPLEQVDMKKSHYPMDLNNQNNKAEGLNGNADNSIPNHVEVMDSISLN